MAAYYNECDANAVAWLRELIARGHIAPGDVDERSVAEVHPRDLRGYTQCHFFAGIGVWSHALRNAGWADDSPVWTGSCPCQPFSASGKRGGTDDQRHLWPAWFRLIRECRPDVCFGEQVASPDGLAWFDFVSADLEGAGYAVGAADTCAAGLGAPHIRQRLYFVADAERGTAERHGHEVGATAGSAPATASQRQRVRADVRHGGDTRSVADTDARGLGIDGGATGERCENERLTYPNECGPDGIVADAERTGRRGRRAGEASTEPGSIERSERLRAVGGVGDTEGGGCSREPVHADRGAAVGDAKTTAGFWSSADWIACRDGKARPVRPGSFPLVTGAPARVVRLRGYGNSLVAPVAEAFIRAYCEVRA